MAKQKNRRSLWDIEKKRKPKYVNSQHKTKNLKKEHKNGLMVMLKTQNTEGWKLESLKIKIYENGKNNERPRIIIIAMQGAV